jgi:hypothetical protein
MQYGKARNFLKKWQPGFSSCHPIGPERLEWALPPCGTMQKFPRVAHKNTAEG